MGQIPQPLITSFSVHLIPIRHLFQLLIIQDRKLFSKEVGLEYQFEVQPHIVYMYIFISHTEFLIQLICCVDSADFSLFFVVGRDTTTCPSACLESSWHYLEPGVDVFQ